VTIARVLVVDDEPPIVRAVRAGLRARGYEVLTAPNGETALDLLTHVAVDLVILDLGLPGLDGQEVINRLRAWSDVPVVVLSVREGQSDKVAALDAGADDYVTKPFAMDELLARLRAVQRRTKQEESPPVLRYGELEVDLARQLVSLGEEPVHLTAKEYRLLEVMVTHPGKLLSHRWLLQKVWGPGYSEETHYLRVFVGQLRQKLRDDAGSPRWIITEPGLGYRWRADPRT
jgi:two-component system KDP operon response regulator KdpE